MWDAMLLMRRRRLVVGFVAIVCSAALVAGEAAPVAADPDATQHRFIAAVNDVRLYLGLRPLVWDAEVDAVADGWAARLAADHRLGHRPDLARAAPRTWVKVGENVGRGESVEEIMSALVASPTHFRNIADPGFVNIGVGVAEVDGKIYVVQNFLTRGKPRGKRVVGRR